MRRKVIEVLACSNDFESLDAVLGEGVEIRFIIQLGEGCVDGGIKVKLARVELCAQRVCGGDDGRDMGVTFVRGGLMFSLGLSDGERTLCTTWMMSARPREDVLVGGVR